jgi:hypothetical protein
MKIGIIFCAYNAKDYLNKSLASWIEARRSRLGGHEWLICAVSVPFKGFPQPPEDGTQEELRKKLVFGLIDELIERNEPMAEIEVRGLALQWLKDKGVEAVWQADADEIPVVKEIENTVWMVEHFPFIPWFRYSFKNRVFDCHTYLVQPFTTPRIHRVRPGNLVADHFWDDNYIAYKLPSGDIIRDVELASVTIPKVLMFCEHFTWLNDERSKRKVEYQTKARGWDCTFAWDDSRGGLVWRDEKNIPKIAHD